MAEPTLYDRLRRLFSRRTAAQAARENPLLLASVARASEIYSAIPLSSFIDADTQNALARRLYLDLNQICNAGDPKTVCREKLARSMLRFAPFQVVMIPPPPTEDSSGLRDLPGITGQLQPRLGDLIRTDTDLRTQLEAARSDLADAAGRRAPPTSAADAEQTWPVVQKSYWEAFWFLESFNAARLALGDSGGVADWYRPFMHAACVNQEHIYRCELDLPPAFDADVAQVVVTAFSIYTDVVVSGAEDPDREWQAYCAEVGVPILDGGRRGSSTRA